MKNGKRESMLILKSKHFWRLGRTVCDFTIVMRGEWLTGMGVKGRNNKDMKTASVENPFQEISCKGEQRYDMVVGMNMSQEEFLSVYIWKHTHWWKSFEREGKW